LNVTSTPTGQVIKPDIIHSQELIGDYLSMVEYQFTVDLTAQSVTRFEIKVGFVNLTERLEIGLTMSVSFKERDYSIPKSGNAGYAFGQPVIAAIVDERGQFIVQNATAGSFPIPFGYDCESVQFTPVLFGVDTIGGCTVRSTNALNLTSYRFFGIHGKANPNNGLDWVELRENCPNPLSFSFQKFVFFYEQFGSVKNAQQRLKSVVHECHTGVLENSPKIVTVVFALVGDQQRIQYVPPNPRPPGIPKNTWYPFSSSEANVGIASPSVLGMVACVVLTLFIV
jgi:hypothetical protein